MNVTTRPAERSIFYTLDMRDFLMAGTPARNALKQAMNPNETQIIIALDPVERIAKYTISVYGFVHKNQDWLHVDYDRAILISDHAIEVTK